MRVGSGQFVVPDGSGGDDSRVPAASAATVIETQLKPVTPTSKTAAGMRYTVLTIKHPVPEGLATQNSPSHQTITGQVLQRQ